MGVTVYVRHSKQCPQAHDRYSRRCRCRKWIDYSLNGKRVLESLKTRSWEMANKKAKDRERQLETGETPVPFITVGEAVAEWLAFRDSNRLSNEKPQFMGRKLTAWCAKEGIERLADITTAGAMQFRMSLPFRTGDSSSLRVHWSVIGGFFSWAKGMKYIAENPIPSGRQNPQFKITFKKKEVVPPTAEQVSKVLAKAEGELKLLVSLMRWSAMALIDAIALTPTKMNGNLIQGNRTKTREPYSVRIPTWLADALRDYPGFSRGGPIYRKRLGKLFRSAGVKMTPHGFRHFRITEWLSQGARVDDVARMVGTSPTEIRKTYQHWTKESQDRLDEVQRQMWLAQGLDENGNERKSVVQ